ncbi:TetR/AcrR family transcriptional regulator [Selenihalanaerobacter shriftii]|uniref:Transcriptional regulator, TetR family n=1 Tax=Selenihalanaerobacter shriftii TaxID=142842 RepID=A0A1T4JK91_9FIRM|nr:TetR/AcrR family transcriptional regulator [Selenihalanaerobacter shriftii]SJZ30576.1 transcriptional regulator, TetR family [Selenihalanaerobacter shriftii]
MTKQELIRKNAAKVIAQEGYHNTTVQMIADEAGVAVGTIYNYFGNKKEILNYIFKVEFKKRTKLLDRLNKEEISLKEKLRIFLDNHFTALQANPNEATVLVQESRLPSKYSLESVDNFINNLPQLLAKILNEAIDKGEIKAINPQLIANAIFHAIRGVAIQAVENQDDYDFEMAKEELFNFIWSGLI